MAPLIAALVKWGFGTLASVVASKGKDLVESKLGINLDDALGTEQGRIQLKQLEIQHEEFLLGLTQATEARDLDYFKVEVEDRGAARLRDSEFVKVGMANWRAHTMYVLAVVIICWLVWIIWKTPDITEYVKGIVTLVLGRFLGYLDNIYNFEFGTTRTSRAKDVTIDRLSGGDK